MTATARRTRSWSRTTVRTRRLTSGSSTTFPPRLSSCSVARSTTPAVPPGRTSSMAAHPDSPTRPRPPDRARHRHQSRRSTRIHPAQAPPGSTPRSPGRCPIWPPAPPSRSTTERACPCSSTPWHSRTGLQQLQSIRSRLRLCRWRMPPGGEPRQQPWRRYGGAGARVIGDQLRWCDRRLPGTVGTAVRGLPEPGRPARHDAAVPRAVAVSDETVLDVTIEDLAMQKSVAPGTFVVGGTATYTVNLQTSEYRSSESIRVVDTLPGRPDVRARLHDRRRDIRAARCGLGADDPDVGCRTTSAGRFGLVHLPGHDGGLVRPDQPADRDR